FAGAVFFLAQAPSAQAPTLGGALSDWTPADEIAVDALGDAAPPVPEFDLVRASAKVAAAGLVIRLDVGAPLPVFRASTTGLEIGARAPIRALALVEFAARETGTAIELADPNDANSVLPAGSLANAADVEALFAALGIPVVRPEAVSGLWPVVTTATLDSTKPNSPGPNPPTLLVGVVADQGTVLEEQVALISFDASGVPDDALVERASLELSVISSSLSQSGPVACVQANLEDWDAAVTFETAPVVRDGCIAVLQIDPGQPPTTLVFDGLDDIVAQWLKDGSADPGLRVSLLADDGSTLELATPKLTVDWVGRAPALPQAPPDVLPVPIGPRPPLPGPLPDPNVVDWSFEESPVFVGWGGISDLGGGPDGVNRAACTWRDPETHLPMGDLVTGDRVRLADGRHIARLRGDYWHAPIFEIGPLPDGAVDEYNCRIDTWFTWTPTSDIDLTSPAFTVDFEFLTFLVGGGGRPETFVALEINESGTWTQVRATNGPGEFAMERVNWDMEPYRGETARLRVVDTFTPAEHEAEESAHFSARLPLLAARQQCLDDHPERGGPAFSACMTVTDSDLKTHADTALTPGQPWIALDDVRAVEYPEAPVTPRVWGFADLHAHLVSELGLRGIYPGELDAGLALHPDSPEFDDGAPQKIHTVMLERAWKGGLRLAVMDVLHNEAFPEAADCSIPLIPAILDLCDLFVDLSGAQRPTRPPERDAQVIAQQIAAVRA
ncbi:MAG: hypothetical protein KJP18_13405, partial [Gemmatimonadetes bacterium]|nr:hypothetical protein [Gemmatimonadota bacterium]